MRTPAETLLAAGAHLAQHYTLAELTEARICADAAIAPEDFRAAFGSVLGYVAALQQQFMDGLRDRIVRISDGTPPGVMRIKLAAETYLSACLEQQPLRGWLIEARAHPQVAEGLRKQNQVYWMIMGTELGVRGWPHPQSAARLFLAMINEAAVAEHRAGEPLLEIRSALWDYLDHGGPALQAA